MADLRHDRRRVSLLQRELDGARECLILVVWCGHRSTEGRTCSAHKTLTFGVPAYLSQCKLLVPFLRVYCAIHTRATKVRDN